MPSPPSSPANASLGQGLSINLSRRYTLILLAIAALLILDQLVVQPRLMQLGIYAPRINIAGRQRMLSQKLVKTALAMRAAEDQESKSRRQTELNETLALWQKSHTDLLDGDEANGLPATSAADIRQAFTELEPHFTAMSSAAMTLAAHPDDTKAIARLLDHEASYLPQMDRIVGMYESEARQRATTLRVLGLATAASIIALMIALGRLVLRPATQTIRAQLEELEQRVDERTAELRAANESLQHEIDVRHQIEARTRELSEQLAHTSRVESLGQLATGLAHEVNQPLASMVNYTEMCAVLLEGSQPDLSAVKASLGNINKAAHRAGDIVRSMRNFLRPGEQAATNVKLSQLIDEVALLCRPELARLQVTLQLDLPSEEPILHVVPIQIQQVLLNLIQNASHAMEETPPDDRLLQIRSRQEAGFVLVEVLDRGHGFVDHNPTEIFEPFLTTKPTGLGMGLAIVRSLVQDHGGKVWAENRRRGAAVCFTLPLPVSHEPTVPADAHCVCG